MILEVPYYSQFKDTQNPELRDKACGIAALKMVLDYYHDPSLSIDELYQRGLEINAFLDGVGWYHHALINIAQPLGFKGVTRHWIIKEEEKQKLTGRGLRPIDLDLMERQLLDEGIYTLLNQIAKKQPVIVSVPRRFDPEGSGHLVTMVGYIDKEEDLIFNDPDDQDGGGKNLYVDLEKFKKVWTKRAIIIEPLGKT